MESDCYHSLSTVFYTELLRRERDPLCTLLPEGWRLWRNWISKIQRERWQTITHAYSLSVSHLTNTHKCCMGLFFFPDSPSSCCTEESTLHGVWFGVAWCKYQCEGRIWENMSSSQCREWIYSSLGGKILMWCWSINIQSLLLHIYSYLNIFFDRSWKVWWEMAYILIWRKEIQTVQNGYCHVDFCKKSAGLFLYCSSWHFPNLWVLAALRQWLHSCWLHLRRIQQY